MPHPYEDLAHAFPDIGRMAAFLRKVCGERDATSVVKDVLSGDLVVTLEEAVKPLFDCHGWRIPPPGLTGKVCAPNREFHLIEPALDFPNLCWQLERYFPDFSRFAFLSREPFEYRYGILRSQVQADKRLANLLNGVCLPVCLPQLEVADYGQVLDEIFLLAVASSYEAQFPAQSFTNYCHGKLAGKVTIVSGTRHDQLLARMAVAPVTGLYFPNPLQGYSGEAQREQMTTLPESLLLCGGLDTAVAWVMYPDVLCRDSQTPVNDCSALQCSELRNSHFA